MQIKLFLIASTLLLAQLSVTPVNQTWSQTSWSQRPGATVRTVTGRVVRVSDGDTITVLGPENRQYKIRLNGIDAPESGQDFGQVSKKSLARLVHGRQVRVTWQKEDRYDRILGRVFVGSTDVNLAQLSAGMAWYYRQYESDVPVADRAPFERAEREARQSRRGLWSAGSATPPWEFRAAARGMNTGSVTRTSTNPPSSPATPAGAVRGNRNSGIYHLPECPDYEKISLRNRVSFKSEGEAQQNGFRKARNCPPR